MNLKLSNYQTVRKFLHADTIVSVTGVIPASALFKGWVRFCERERYFARNPIWLGRQLNIMSVPKQKRKDCSVYLGLQLRDEAGE